MITVNPNRHLSVGSLLAVLALHSLGGPGALGQPIEEIRAAVDRGNEVYIAAMATPDARAFADVYDARGYRLTGGGEVIRGRQAILNQMGEFFTRVGPIQVTIETADLWAVDSLAYETGAWTFTFTPPGDSRRTIGGRYVTIWKQQADGGWKILADMSVPGTEQ